MNKSSAHKEGATKRMLVSLLAAVIVVAGAASLQAQAPQAPKKLTLAMPVTPPNLVHIPPYLAKDLGYFREEGLDVEIVSFEGGVGSLRAVMAGSVELALTSSDPSILARVQGAPIRMIYSPSPRLSAVMTVQGNIKEIKDLKGKRIGIVEPDGFPDLFALITDQVDTVVLPSPEQAIRAIKRNPNLRNLVNFWEMFPDAHFAALVAQEKVIKEKPDVVEAFIRAVIKANRYIYRNKKGTLDAAAEITGFTIEELEPAYDQLTKGRVWSVNDGLPRKSVEFTIDNLVWIGRIPADKTPTYEQLVDLGPVYKALEKLGRWTDDPLWQ